ncbi:MAG: mechanosensitive ion channel [Candidatus Omnitrophica bacterium]|nr:mechanosensitive ion channel [Candidatus Omnitrophota bacterium]
MQTLFQGFLQTVGTQLPSLASALAILIIGWLVALVVAAVVQGVLGKDQFDKKLIEKVSGSKPPAHVEPAKWIAKGVFYFLMLLVLVAFFQALGLTIVTAPLNHILVQIADYAPRLLSATLLLLVAWALARLLQLAITFLLDAANVDDRFDFSVSETCGNIAYWFVLFIFLPAILGALSLQGLLTPVQEMVGKILGFLPNLVAGGLILLIGIFAARIIQGIVSNILEVIGAERFSERIGLKNVLGKQTLSEIVGLIIRALILISVVIAALDALQLGAISEPASRMLSKILETLPSIFAAALVILLAYWVGRFIRELVTDLLSRLGFNRIFTRLGLGAIDRGERTPSEVVGYLVLVAVLIIASIEAARLLGFHVLATLLAQFISFIGPVILGLVILGVGLFLANLVSKIIQERETRGSQFLAVTARIAILLISLSMALDQMGVAAEIVRIAFTLLLGAIAVASALAFGLGARDVAGKEVEKWISSLKRSK